MTIVVLWLSRGRKHDEEVVRDSNRHSDGELFSQGRFGKESILAIVGVERDRTRLRERDHSTPISVKEDRLELFLRTRRDSAPKGFNSLALLANGISVSVVEDMLKKNI
ncbi:MAG: hypothetical protein ABSB29_09035 [Nitrososphaerales archaeon]